MSATNENRPSNLWDEKLWAFANIKAARDFGLNTASELNNKAAEIIGLSTEQKEERAKNDKLRYVVTSEWSRTDLKNKGLIINESRGTGIWRLTSIGLHIRCNTYETFLIDYKQILKNSTMNYLSQEIISGPVIPFRFSIIRPDTSAKALISCPNIESLNAVIATSSGVPLTWSEYSQIVFSRSSCILPIPSCIDLIVF